MAMVSSVLHTIALAHKAIGIPNWFNLIVSILALSRAYSHSNKSRSKNRDNTNEPTNQPSQPSIALQHDIMKFTIVIINNICASSEKVKRKKNTDLSDFIESDLFEKMAITQRTAAHSNTKIIIGAHSHKHRKAANQTKVQKRRPNSQRANEATDRQFVNCA